MKAKLKGFNKKLDGLEVELPDNVSPFEFQRRARKNGLTITQLNEFNAVCKTGKETIEWHAPTWVAMSRNQYDELKSEKKKKRIVIYEDEYSNEN